MGVRNIQMKKTNRNLLFLLLSLTLASFILLLLFEQPAAKGSDLIAIISRDGKPLERINLNEVTAPYTLVFEDDQGGRNTVAVSPCHICIVSSNCPDQLCVKHGPVEAGGPPAVCLPHHFMIEVISETKPQIDTYTH